jgi:hypothetical protein
MRRERIDQLVFSGEDGGQLIISYDNRGDPFREGVSFDLDDDGKHSRVFLENHEAIQLRDALNKAFPR